MSSVVNLCQPVRFDDDSEAGSVRRCHSPESYMSTGSGSLCSDSRAFRVPEKLQIVKPIEGKGHPVMTSTRKDGFGSGGRMWMGRGVSCMWMSTETLHTSNFFNLWKPANRHVKNLLKYIPCARSPFRPLYCHFIIN